MAAAGQKKGRGPSLLPEELLPALIAAGQVDVLVGIPTLDHAATIGRVVQTVMESFASPALARERTLLLDADGGSVDGTPEIVRGMQPDGQELVLAHHPLRTVHRVATPYHGVPGRHSALRLVFAAADLLGAKAVVIIDPDARALTSESVATLARAVLDHGYELVKPIAPRSPWERPLSTQLVAPLLRAAYGKRLIEPLSTQLACSGRFASRVLHEFTGWEAPDASQRLDPWLTTRALIAPARIAQVWAHGAGEPAHARRPAPLAVFQQVVSALLAVIRDDRDVFEHARGSEGVPTLGAPATSSATRPAFDLSRFAATFRDALRDLGPVLEPALGAETVASLQAAGRGDKPQLSAELWAEVTMRAVSSALDRTLPAAQVASALFPLYLGRVASFYEETRELGVEAASAENERVALAFEQAKAALLDANKVRGGE